VAEAAQPDGAQVGVMIVDDHELVRRGLAEVMAHSPNLAVIAEAGNVADAVRRAPLVKPGVIVVDVRLPDGNGIDLIRRLRPVLPGTRFVVLSSIEEDGAVADAYDAGASAYLIKTVRGSEVVKAVQDVAAGRVLLDARSMQRRRARQDDPTSRLTQSERNVLELIGDGLSNREIGERLNVAEKTVKNHITSILAKMGLQRRTQVAALVAGQRASDWRH
jgi:DNA-binding NarL/FixJ family response regulator